MTLRSLIIALAAASGSMILVSLIKDGELELETVGNIGFFAAALTAAYLYLQRSPEAGPRLGW